MRTRFVSPLSPVSADYYKFEITDTVPVGAEQCVELSFVPHNAESQGFNGKLYVPVTTDTMRYVKRAVLRMPQVHQSQLHQDHHDQSELQTRLLGKSPQDCRRHGWPNSRFSRALRNSTPPARHDIQISATTSGRITMTIMTVSARIHNRRGRRI